VTRAHQSAAALAAADPGRALALYVPHLRQGGGETSMLRLAGGLAAQGLAVQLIVHTLDGAELAVPDGVQALALHTDGTVASLRRLATLLRQHQPHSLLSAFPHSNVAAMAALAWSGIDCVGVVSEHAPLSQQIRNQANWRYRVLPPLVRWAYRRADAVVAVSAGVRDDLQALVGPGLALHTIANPVLGADDDGVRVGTPLHRWLCDDGLQVVLSVSRLSAEKDIPTLLRAFARLRTGRPALRLLLAGDGPERAALQALVAELGLGAVVELPGRVQRPRAWMGRAAAFALASRYEGFGNVLVEALASNLPVVATDCPVGPREILDGGRWGRLVPVGDWQALADALGQALQQRGAPAGALAHAAQYTDAAACSAYRRLFAQLGAPC